MSTSLRNERNVCGNHSPHQNSMSKAIINLRFYDGSSRFRHGMISVARIITWASKLIPKRDFIDKSFVGKNGSFKIVEIQLYFFNSKYFMWFACIFLEKKKRIDQKTKFSSINQLGIFYPNWPTEIKIGNNTGEYTYLTLIEISTLIQIWYPFDIAPKNSKTASTQKNNSKKLPWKMNFVTLSNNTLSVTCDHISKEGSIMS